MPFSGNPTTLYIIGNGFDRHHGLPTAYSDFRDDVRSRAPHVAALVDEWLPAGDDWGDLENALGDFDADFLISEAGNHLQSYGAEDWSDASHFAFQEAIEAVVRPLSEELSELFEQWVQRVPNLTPQQAVPWRLPLQGGATFLSFNYTHTLATAYGIPERAVWHVHGVVGAGKPLILGHAYDHRPLRIVPGPDEDDPIGDPREAEGLEIIDSYFRGTFKPADRIIASNPAFFSALNEIDEVWILGHAIGRADWAYYRALIRAIPTRAIWRASYHVPHERAERIEALTGLGVSADRIQTITLPSLVAPPQRGPTP